MQGVRQGGVVVGYYIWTAKHSGPVPPDPLYEEHLGFLAEHPHFEEEVERLRKQAPDPVELARVAGMFRITRADLQSFIAAEGDEVLLEAAHDKIYVELRQDEYLLHVPRPITPARRDTLIRWAKEARGWRHPAATSDGDVELKEPRSHPVETTSAHLDWYRSWLEGKSYLEIYREVDSDPAGRPKPDDVRNRLRAIHRRMKDISSEGLPDAGP